MGGRIAKLFNRDEQNDEKQNLPSHPVDAIDSASVASEYLDQKLLMWYERAFLDNRLRVGSVLILGVVLGIIIPFVVFITKLDNDDHRIYGSCLINENARFECLINSVNPVDEKFCTEALCCWENSENTPFKCYYSLPSAYQYNVESSTKRTVNGTEWTNLELTPRYHDKMDRFEACIGWQSTSHLEIQISPQAKCSTNSRLERNRAGVSAEYNESRLNATWGSDNDFFFISVARQETNETIFDTRLGPVIVTEEYITLSTALPTPYFYGLRGGQGTAQSALTYGIINGFESMEFPFYMSYEKSGNWHGVLVDVAEPMIVQILQAPAIMFHLESTTPEMNFHIFSGPTQQAVLDQLHTYIREKNGFTETEEPFIPPFWGLGVHLCRKSKNATSVLKEIEAITCGKSIPYDSDCIEEGFRNPINVDRNKFPLENITGILEHLASKKTRVMLSQMVTAPSNTTSLSAVSWLFDISNASDIRPFLGKEDNVTYKYIDFFRTHYTNFTLSEAEGIPLNGIFLSDNFPKLYIATNMCAEPKTRLQKMFTVTTNGRYNSSVLWTSVCPELFHTASNTTSIGTINVTHGGVSHQKLHNLYGEESLKQMRALLDSLASEGEGEDEEEDEDENMDIMISSASVWLSSMYYGGFKGLQVPFSWKGLQDSVAHTIRNYALAPIAGTPICGSMIYNLSIVKNDDLCLRWFQFGLLLPVTHNSYDGRSSYGPVHFGNQHREYLAASIRLRYTLSPYYRTLLYNYQTKLQPFIAPTSFHFNEATGKDNRLGLLDQFMIGEAILAAPIIQNGVIRYIYFPPGIWYTMDGVRVSENTESGRNTQITGHITETPLFLKGGITIPTMPSENANSIEETTQSIYKYSLLIALGSPGTTRFSNGSLIIKDGVNFQEITFDTSASREEIIIDVSTLNSTCDLADFSTTIDEVQIFGISKLLPDEFEITVTPPGRQLLPDDHRKSEDILLIFNLQMDWCKETGYQVVVAPKTEENP